jgi:type III secretory pathway component EscS
LVQLLEQLRKQQLAWHQGKLCLCPCFFITINWLGVFLTRECEVPSLGLQT